MSDSSINFAHGFDTCGFWDAQYEMGNTTTSRLWLDCFTHFLPQYPLSTTLAPSELRMLPHHFDTWELLHPPYLSANTETLALSTAARISSASLTQWLMQEPTAHPTGWKNHVPSHLGRGFFASFSEVQLERSKKTGHWRITRFWVLLRLPLITILPSVAIHGPHLRQAGRHPSALRIEAPDKSWISLTSNWCTDKFVCRQGSKSLYHVGQWIGIQR